MKLNIKDKVQMAQFNEFALACQKGLEKLFKKVIEEFDTDKVTMEKLNQWKDVINNDVSALKDFEEDLNEYLMIEIERLFKTLNWEHPDLEEIVDQNYGE
jgi:hypothetical protein